MNKRYEALKRIAVAALLMDKDGRIVILDPVYKDGWLLPGGIAERGEAPREAIRREVAAELGIEIPPPKRLLSVDYRGPQEEYIMFIFDCGTLDDETIAQIRLPEERFSAFRFVTPDEATRLLRENSARRLLPTLRAKANGTIAYLEYGNE